MKKSKTKEFLEEALASSTDKCVLWPYAKDRAGGYGQFRKDGKMIRAHRYMCELAHGTAPLEHQAAHACGNSACVNPRHLRWATAKENQADRITHGTTNRGERSGSSKLTEADVLEIRRLYATGDVTQQELADRWHVRISTICDIINRKCWKHV